MLGILVIDRTISSGFWLFAVIFATGVVGRELLAGLQEAGCKPEQITALASERSAGSEVDFLDDSLEVEKTASESFRGIGLALLAVPPDAARTLAQAAQAAGAWVVDVSPAFRLDPGTPMVVPGVNDQVLDSPFAGRIVSCASPITSALLAALEPVRRLIGLERVHVTALLGASNLGRGGVDELEKQTAGLLSGRDPDETPYPHRLAFNLFPQVGAFTGEWTTEELGMRTEAARVWGAPPVEGTAVQVPTFYGCCLSVTLELARPSTSDELRAAFKQGKAEQVLDSPAEKVYPMPMLVTADPTVHVGRVRVLSSAPSRAVFFLAVDNAGRGAALNAVEIGQRLSQRPV